MPLWLNVSGLCRLIGATAVIAALCLPWSAGAQELILKNDRVQRVLEFDGQVWRTTQFARADGSRALPVQSDEFHLLLFDDRELTLDQYRAAGEPVRDTVDGTQRVIIRYVPRAAMSNTPSAVTIRYLLADGPYLRKEILLEMKEGESIDRLEVERFSVTAPASRGGRGEPVFVDSSTINSQPPTSGTSSPRPSPPSRDRGIGGEGDQNGRDSGLSTLNSQLSTSPTDWFFGVEYPAFYSRHTDGNTPAAASGPYDRLGNYSFIDLEKRDVDSHPRPGLIRLMHFPGYAKKQPDGSWGIVGKTAVAGARMEQPTMELAFLDYLDTIRRPVRSFVHYNNWYDREGKRLTIDNFVTNTFLRFKENLDPYGVGIDAMVPDSGWQNPRSIYQPNPSQFPGGMDDLAALGAALRQAGTQLGLWIALNGYSSDIDWGRTNGYVEAERNTHFSRFRRYYSLTHSNYNAEISRQLTNLIARGQVQYLKHDFNEMCDVGDGRGHPPTDRHGHEASVDAEIDLLVMEREQNEEIYQNITNWIWFSPWWLAHGNNLWMLASDAGEFRDWPELSLLVMAAAYRDVHLYRAWGNPETRPLVPISHLMTHGIIYTPSKYGGGADSLRDFADYVMMYYMRGLQLKEWYITPRLLSKEQWEVLGRATRWSQENMDVLANAVLAGGNPANGEPYAYMAWKGDSGILSVRNPGPGESEISVPFDATVWHRGAAGREFRARVIYPYQADWPAGLKSGEPIRITVPGYSVLVFHVDLLQAGQRASPPGLSSRFPTEERLSALAFTSVREGNRWRVRGTLPNEAMQRCDLLVTSGAGVPQVRLNDILLQSARTNRGRGWEMAAFDLLEFQGKEVDLSLESDPDDVTAWLIMDRPVQATAANADPRQPAPVAHGFRRQTLRLVGGDSAPR